MRLRLNGGVDFGQYANVRVERGKPLVAKSLSAARVDMANLSVAVADSYLATRVALRETHFSSGGLDSEHRRHRAVISIFQRLDPLQCRRLVQCPGESWESKVSRSLIAMVMPQVFCEALLVASNLGVINPRYMLRSGCNGKPLRASLHLQPESAITVQTSAGLIDLGIIYRRCSEECGCRGGGEIFRQPVARSCREEPLHAPRGPVSLADGRSTTTAGAISVGNVTVCVLSGSPSGESWPRRRSRRSTAT